MVTSTQANANLEAAIANKADVESNAKEAMAKGDLAKVMKLGGDFQKAEAAISKAEREIKSAEVELSKGERDTLEQAFTKGMAARKADIDKAMHQVHPMLILNRSGDDTGFDDYLIKVSIDDDGDALSLIIHEIMESIGADSVSSAKRIRLVSGEVSVDPVSPGRVTRTPSGDSNGGSAGKGFDKDGVHLTLQAAFDQSATAEEKAHYDTLSGSNATYTYKKKVVLAAGFTQS